MSNVWLVGDTLTGMGEGRRRVGLATAVCLAVTVSVTWAGPARADGAITVTSSGPVSITANTDAASAAAHVTFDIVDPTLTATGATICDGRGDKKRRGCTYQRFDTPPVDEYGDPVEPDPYSTWTITGGPGHWTVAYPVGFDPISRDDCLAAAWSKEPFHAGIEVQNDAGTILATSSWTYSVTCTGIEGGVSGPSRIKVSASRTVRAKSWTYVVLDTKHELNAYRVCRYNFALDTYGACDYEDLTKVYRTKDGWVVRYFLSFLPMGAASCSWIGRNWPDASIRIQFYSGDLDKRLTLYGTARLDC